MHRYDFHCIFIFMEISFSADTSVLIQLCFWLNGANIGYSQGNNIALLYFVLLAFSGILSEKRQRKKVSSVIFRYNLLSHSATLAINHYFSFRLSTLRTSKLLMKCYIVFSLLRLVAYLIFYVRHFSPFQSVHCWFCFLSWYLQKLKFSQPQMTMLILVLLFYVVGFVHKINDI